MRDAAGVYVRCRIVPEDEVAPADPGTELAVGQTWRSKARPSATIILEQRLTDVTPAAWTVRAFPADLPGAMGEQQIINNYTLADEE
jgi:fumarylacetoacetate (FAA) hydrolase family protein